MIWQAQRKNGQNAERKKNISDCLGGAEVSSTWLECGLGGILGGGPAAESAEGSVTAYSRRSVEEIITFTLSQGT